MDYNLLANLEYCKSFVLGISSLLYYTHIPSATLALIIGLFVLIRSRTSLLGKILFAITVVFALWVVLNLTIWRSVDASSLIMAAWAPIEVFALLIFALCLYFVHVFTAKHDAGFLAKCCVGLLFLPLLIFLPTTYNLTGYDLQECVAMENSHYTSYGFTLKMLFTLSILALSITRYSRATDPQSRRQIALLGMGVLVFLASFFLAGFVSYQTGDFRYEMFGLFGMVVFVGVLAYLIVNFRTFNIKLISSQVLVAALVVLVASQFAFIQNPINRILNAFTVLLLLIFGYYLIKSVQREIHLREQVQDLAVRLKSVNSILSHDVKNVLGKHKDIFWEALQGTFGAISDDMKDICQMAFKDTKQIIHSIMSILQAGHDIVLVTKQLDLKLVVLQTVADLTPDAHAKGLVLQTHLDESQDYTLVADKDQLVTHVLHNLIENAIHYTLQGSIDVELSARGDATLVLRVKDTGVGIGKDDMKRLFTEGGHGKDSARINVHSTGYGLFIAKKIIDAHGGKIWAASQGVNRGSTFTVELPRR